MKSLFAALLLTFASLTHVFAQTNTVSGTIKDAETRAPLAFCTIVQQDLPSNATISDDKGKFNLPVSTQIQSITVTVSFLGYQTQTITIPSSNFAAVEINLHEDTRTLDEVVVSGSSRAVTIKESPLAIELVSTDQINRGTESNLIESLSRHVPGMSTVTTGPNISKPFIRGLGYNRVLTLFDGIRQEGQQWGDEHGIEIDNYNVDRVEVIKGPASLMYGSDAVAGVVSIFPFVPKEKNGLVQGQLISEYQSNNGLFGTGLRVGLGSKNVLWSVSASLRKAGNYFNDVDKYVYNTSFEEKNISGVLGLTGTHGESRFNFTMYDDLQGIPDGSRDSLTRRFTYQIAEGASDNIKNRPVVSDEVLGGYKISPLHQHIQHYRIYSTHRYTLAYGDVNIQLGVQQNRRQEFTHPTLPGQAGLSVRLNTLNYGVRYNAPEFAGIELTAGINGMVQQNKNLDATDFPVPDYRLLDAGAFGSFQWRKRKWVTSGGIRFDSRTINGQDFFTSTDPSTGFFAQSDGSAANAKLHFPALHQKFAGTSLSLGTTLQLSDRWSLKINIAKGYRAPNIAEIASNGLDPGAHIVYIGNRNFVPEFSLQQDIGVRLDLTDVSVNASIFNNNVSNYIYLNQLVDANGNPIELVQGNKTFQYEQSSAHLFGAELTAELHPHKLKGFTLTNNAAITYGNRSDKAFRNAGVDGQYLPFIPPLHLFSAARQEFQLRSRKIPSWSIGADMDLVATQNRYLALFHTETRTAGYTLFNFALGVDIQYAAKAIAHIQLQVNNAFDQVWQSNLSRLKYFEYYSASPNGRSGMYGMGRNFCIKIIVPL